MLRLAQAIMLCRYYKPRIMNINNLIKKTNLPTQQPTANIQHNGARGEKLNAEMEKDKGVSLQTLKDVIQYQKTDLTKEEHTINYQIKIETKAYNLYALYKARSNSFTARNIVNLLIKVLELRHINLKEAEQTQKFDRLIATVGKKVSKMSPEDMIRYLFCLKKVAMLNSDLKRMNPLIHLILNEFSSRGKLTKSSDTFDSFMVISVDSNIKFLHSLQYLHSISGQEYEPVIFELIKGNLLHFYELATRKSNPLASIKLIKWYFYFSFIKIAGRYDLPLNVVLTFVKAINFHKKIYQSKSSLLFGLQENIHELKIVRQRCRGENIGKYRELFEFHRLIFDNLQKPNELIKMRPIQILKHLKYLNEFTEEQLKNMEFVELKSESLHRILLFTLKIYEKYLSKHFLNLVQKSNIQKWIKDSEQNHIQLLRQILILYNQLIQEKIIINSSQYNKLLNLCLQSFEQLSFCSQSTIIQIAFVKSFKNSKIILDVFFNSYKPSAEGSKRQFKKHQELQAYMELFPHWKGIKDTIKFTTDEKSEGAFLKLFFTQIIHIKTPEETAHLFSKRAMMDREFLSLMIKKYVRASEQNRTLSKNFFDMTQSNDFKAQISTCSLIENENEDNFKLSEFVRLKYRLRQKMKRGLSNFKFFILLLENINRSIGRPEVNITQNTLFNEIYFHFEQEMKCLNYKQLITCQIADLISQICQYLLHKGVESNSSVFTMNMTEHCLKKRGQLLNNSYKLIKVNFQQKNYISLNKLTPFKQKASLHKNQKTNDIS